MRILVTGKSSFIGNCFAEHVRGIGEEYDAELVSVRGDFWKSMDLSEYDCIVHAAGIAHVGYKDDMAAEYMAVNRDLTLDIARKARESGVKQFIFLSSIIIYGAAADAGRTRIITAGTIPSPENAYGQSKLEAEEGLRKLERDDFRVAILRLPMVYGNGSRGNFALISKYAGYLPLFPSIGGERSAIYVENLAEFIRITADRGASGTFYPTDEKPVTTPELLKAVRCARGRKTCTLRIFDPFVRLIGRTGIARRVFGGLRYSDELTASDWDYRIYDLDSAAARCSK